MSRKGVKSSLIVLAVLALGLAALSFLTANVAPPAVNNSSSLIPDGQNTEKPQERLAQLSIDFGDGRIETFEVKPDGTKNLFQIMKEKTVEKGVALHYESYSGLGELITQIGDKKNGTEDKYWQFWTNGAYAQVGASSYIVQPGDVIEWKFNNAQQ